MSGPSPWVDSPQRTMSALLDARLESDPDGPYLDVCGTAWTAAELDAYSNRLAHGLASLGVGKGDRVATLLENSPAAVAAWFATLKLGAIAVPVNTAHKGVYLAHQLTDAAPRVFLVQGDLADRTPGVLENVPELEHVVSVGEPGARTEHVPWHDYDALLTTDESRPPAVARPADLAALVYTGGTTGPSKGCMLSHAYCVRMAEANMHTWKRRADDVVWTPLPLFHFNAIQMALTGTLVTGGSAVLARRFSLSGFWPAINASNATIASLLGSLVVLIARDVDRPEQPSSGALEANTTLRMVTGAPMPAEIDALLRERFKVAVYSEAYGTTEASLQGWLPGATPSRAGSAGVINDEDFDVRIFDDDDREVPPDTPGEIVCRPRKANVMFSGYWRRPDATVEANRNNWLHNGDIGRVDADGYLFFIDRKADYIRRRGENISSWEVEQTFHQHELVEDVAVSAIPSEVSEDEVKVTLVLKPGAVLTEEELCRWSVDHLPFFAVPRYIEFREDLPRTETGRITKAALRDEGLTPATWDREAAGLTFERR